MIRLVLGGEKSGKSDMAYAMFRAARGAGVIMAMGLARDMAFRRQILDHRLRRDPSIPVVEPGLELARELTAARAEGLNALVDNLDFWVFACMEDGRDRSAELLDALAGFEEPGAPSCVLVSCEVGLGPVASSALVRRFARAQGALNQSLAALASEVRLSVAGLSVTLK
jgi:adenosylcobinamide kinase / adenosylcobinamide-phosphate guanylyltransferase